MMEKLPEGTVIGQMRASFDWVLSHTARFAGIVVVTVQESRGFILIDKGKPLAYYFRHGKRVLKGHTAYEYFRSQDAILFELRRYSPEEMAKAFEIASQEDKKTPSSESVFLSEKSPGVPDETVVSDRRDLESSSPVEMPSKNVPYETVPTEEPETGKPGPGQADSQHTGILATTTLVEGADNDETTDPAIHEEGQLEPDVEEKESRLFETEADVVANVGELLLGQIVGLPGVVAVSIFKQSMNILSIGDINLEGLIDDAEDLIGSAKEVSSVIRTGPFVQMTIQIPSGNVIIAPYWDEYLCILTRSGVNLGQIRKILRDIPAGNIPGHNR
jgi:hypothetical protein